MRIVIIAPGSRGDVEPYVALGKGLQEAGHVVRLVTHQDFENLVQSHGLTFYPVEGSVQDIAQSTEMSGLLERGNFLAIIKQMAKEAEKGAIRLAEVGLAACQGMEVILAGIGGIFIGFALAEKLDLPLLQAYYIPLTPTREFPSFLLPRLPSWLGGGFNRLSFHLGRQIMWQGFRSADRRARKEVLGLLAAPLLGPYTSKRVVQYPILYGYSPAVIPPPADWDEHIHVSGYWFLDPSEDWTPPTDLVRFLEAGPTPVYVGFGSMSNQNPGETTKLVLEALECANQRAVLLSGWGGLRTTDLPDTVYQVDSVPFGWLFPRMLAVVHHGGAGTTAAGLRAGVPSIVVPFFGDQAYWGQRVATLGVGPKPIPRKKLTVERLASAIQEAVRNQSIRDRAADLGAVIRAEDGVAEAVAVVGEIERKVAG
jgi:sterol 3beta-glucosyltransferase